ncbi:MAG: LamG-like jellyroll fold domain-containing protein [Candidatus Planktophila sp.]
MIRHLGRLLLSLVVIVPSIAVIYEAHAATLLVTVDPNAYSGSGNVTDSTSGLIGTPTNVSYLSGTNCGVFSFGGNSIIAFPQTNFGTQFSISAWVKPNSGSSIQTIISNAGANQNTNGFKAYWNTWNTNDLKMIVEDRNGSAGAATVSTTAVVTNSEWQHLVYTFNTSTNVITMYRNGTAVTTNGTALVASPNTNQAWWLGAIGGSSYYMNAQLGVVKIYSTVLTQAEVTSDYNSTSARYAATPTCPVPAAPTNSLAPSISGTTAYAGVLTATNGTWSSNPTGYTYQWQSSSTANGTYANISGATSQSYTLTTADIGNYLKVNVTATNAGGSNSVLSGATSQITKATQTSLSASLSVTAKTYPYSQDLTITPSGGSGTGATSYAIASGGTASGCALSNATSTPTITASSFGTCLIAATKAADTNYLSATSANVTFSFNRATPTSLTITSTASTYLETLTLITSGGQSSASDTFSVTSGPCSVSGSLLSSSAYGTCYVTAYRAADSNFSATSSASTAITIVKAAPALSYAVSTPPVFRQISNISVTSSTAGTFKFLINEKVIPGCHSKIANAGNGYVAICAWKPALRNYVSLSMVFTPVNSSYLNGKIVGPTYLVAPRSSSR